MLEGKVAVIGVGQTKMGKHQDKTPHELAIEAIKDAIEDSGIDKEDIDGLFTTPQGYMVEQEKFFAQRMAEYLRISPKSMSEFDCGGVTSALAFKYAVNEILLGNNKINLVYATQKEIPREEVQANPLDYLHLIRAANALFGSYDARYGITSPLPYYAMSVQRYMYEYGVDPRHIANLAVVLRDNASKNPIAMLRDRITVEDVLSSRITSPPIHLLESCPWANGAAAIILASGQRAREISNRPIYITGIGEFHDPSSFFPIEGSASEFRSVRISAEQALKISGRKIEEVDVAEVYGAFAGVELMIYEELGFFKKGEAPHAVWDGKTRIDGEIPINTSGGRLSLGHPPYVTPLLEIIEVVLQLRGDAGQRQVKDSRVGLVQTEHGMINGSLVAILERDIS